MSFRPTPSDLMRFKLRTAMAQTRYESPDERAARKTKERFLAVPAPMTDFGCLDPFQTDERAAEALEQS